MGRSTDYGIILWPRPPTNVCNIPNYGCPATPAPFRPDQVAVPLNLAGHHGASTTSNIAGTSHSGTLFTRVAYQPNCYLPIPLEPRLRRKETRMVCIPDSQIPRCR